MIANIGDLPWVVAIALIVLVGGSQLPKIARNIGLAGKEFRKAHEEAERDTASSEQSAIPAAPSEPASANGAVRVPDPSDSSRSDSSITLTPAQLEALLNARAHQASSGSGAH
jgi:Sec-independent protein translocase protein TatA